jgi:DUF4097 and DUF4098 domain-containing protein YvlB
VEAETWLVDGPKVIDVEGVRRLKVALLGGQVDVVGHDEPGARVEVHSVSGRDLLVRFEDGVLEVDHPQVRWDDWLETFRSFKATAAADVSIMVPRAIALKLGVVGASALISGLVTDAAISTITGALVVDGVRGDLQVNTVNGEITVRGHTGRLSAKTVSGDVTVSGEVPSFAADSVSGDVLADLEGAADAVRVNTVSGAVTIRLDSQLATAYSINTVSGRMQLDDVSVSGLRGRYTAQSGMPGEPRVDVRINTVSGATSVLHAVRA